MRHMQSSGNPHCPFSQRYFFSWPRDRETMNVFFKFLTVLYLTKWRISVSSHETTGSSQRARFSTADRFASRNCVSENANSRCTKIREKEVNLCRTADTSERIVSSFLSVRGRRCVTSMNDHNTDRRPIADAPLYRSFPPRESHREEYMYFTSKSLRERVEQGESGEGGRGWGRGLRLLELCVPEHPGPRCFAKAARTRDIVRDPERKIRKKKTEKSTKMAKVKICIYLRFSTIDIDFYVNRIYAFDLILV